MKKIIVYLCLFLGLQMVFTGIGLALAQPLIRFYPQLSHDASAIGLQMGTLLSGLCFIAIVLLRKEAAITRGNIPPSAMFPLLVCSALFTLGQLLPSNWLLEHTNLPNKLKDTLEVLMKYPMGAIALSLVIPVAEELMFRGIVFKNVLNITQKPWWAIAISALTFAIVHLNPVQIAFALPMGIVLGWVYWRTGSLWPCIVIHITNNLSATVFTLCFGSNSTTETLLPDASLRYGTLFIGGLVCICSLMLINRLTRNMVRPEAEPTNTPSTNMEMQNK